eukprot:CAMPEP_0177655216 /NCGR_PEP_ID=MMETSP0447-20121125/14823_1 /TAXON_ID=0 /ORGANISM="Stygamoeba regulata, Strain BSH-02190019" /LENGTH=256 /DNA_ID=CAMNT_0019159069 /DNA_START=221 /DNA_END=991 /DNA_ORIENTATION=-
MSSKTVSTVGYLSQEDAAKVDEELMGELGFTLEQLMELAGQSVANAVYNAYATECGLDATAATRREGHEEAVRPARVLIVAGPGNNGGDGLVAARHLSHFGFECDLHYPRPSTRSDFFGKLLQQCENVGVQQLEVLPSADEIDERYGAVVDAIFGFSFRGSVRGRFVGILKTLRELKRAKVASVDIPSGWLVEEGNVCGEGVDPDLLISLTAPKLCARHFHGRFHYLGGRFVPSALDQKYQLNLPRFPGVETVVRL